MTRRQSMLDRMAERVMDLDSPAYGDERERAVFMEASTFGLTTGLYVGLLGAVVSSLFGLILLPVALLMMTILPAAATSWYARRRGVDVQKLVDRAGDRTTMINVVTTGSAMVLTSALMSYTVFTGDPLLTPPSFDVTPGEGFWGGLAQGAVVGGMLGGLAAVVGGVIGFRRGQRRRRTERG